MQNGLTNVEVEKLKSVGIITKIKYSTWLINMVLVWELSNKWCMCIDINDMNVYPKDPYQLPNNDRLIDRSSSYKIPSFMDDYLSYNQIKMDPIDMPKTN